MCKKKKATKGILSKGMHALCITDLQVSCGTSITDYNHERRKESARKNFGDPLHQPLIFSDEGKDPLPS